MEKLFRIICSYHVSVELMEGSLLQGDQNNLQIASKRLNDVGREVEIREENVKETLVKKVNVIANLITLVY